jgi:hypothetical protein
MTPDGFVIAQADTGFTSDIAGACLSEQPTTDLAAVRFDLVIR